MKFHGENYSTYYTKHIFGNNELYFIVNLDATTKAFSIIPINKQEYETKILEPIVAISNQEAKVEKNEYNITPYKYYEEVDILDRYFQDYLELALFNPEMAYERLNEEYKNKKFENYENFTQYIENNKENLETMCKATRKKYTDFDTYQEYEEYYSQVSKMDLQKYEKEYDSGIKRYICIDGNGSYYIFDINSIMDYTLILDTYTIDLPEFTEKYNEANDADKAGMNLQKITDAINDKDYKYVYNKLDETFKQNNFKNQSDFENYCKSVFYTNNNIEFSNYQNSGTLHMFDAKFTNKDNNTESITKTFIIKLLEGTDFVMSFNVN